METTRFYQELDKLRLTDPTSLTGRESDRSFAIRLGIANKSLTLYRHGTMPKAETVKVIAKGYNTETYYRLLSAAAGDERRPASERSIQIFKIGDVTTEGPKTGAQPVFNVNVPIELNVAVSRASLLGLKLDGNDDTCEPRVPKGACVIYSNTPSDPENQSLYVFNVDGETRVALVRVRGRGIWRSYSTLEELEQISLKDFEDTVIGKVIMIYSLEIHVPGVTDK